MGALAFRLRLVARAALAALAVFCGLLVGTSSAAASPSTVAEATADVNGTVYASVQVGDRTFIAGDFTTAGGLPRLNAAAIRADGTVDPSWDPAPNGIVYALAASDDGATIYLGGAFSTVGSTPRSRLAAVDAGTGAAVRSWRANAGNLIRALSVSGDRLYVGGRFAKIGGVSVSSLASLEASTGKVDPAFAPNPDLGVRALTVSPDGQHLYVGGGFTSIGGVRRPGIAELNGASGQVTDFAPVEGGVVIAADLTPDGQRLFFSTKSNRTWAYDPAVSNTGVYRVRTSGDVQAIVATESEVYIGGHFSALPEAKLDRPKLASFLIDGTPTDWRVDVDSFIGVWTITATPDFLAIGGGFHHIDGVAQKGFARFAGTP